MRYISGTKLNRRMANEAAHFTGIPVEQHSRYAFLMTGKNRVPHNFKHPLPLAVPLADISEANQEAKKWCAKQQQAKRFNAGLKADGLGTTHSSKRRQSLSAEERDARKLRELRRRPSYIK